MAAPECYVIWGAVQRLRIRPAMTHWNIMLNSIQHPSSFSRLRVKARNDDKGARNDDKGTRNDGIQNKKGPKTKCPRAFRKAAATYSPTWCSSTIGASELNFSVRYGKRWILTAIATAVFYLREMRRSKEYRLTERSRAISTGQLNMSPCVHFLPINVVVSHGP